MLKNMLVAMKQACRTDWGCFSVSFQCYFRMCEGLK